MTEHARRYGPAVPEPFKPYVHQEYPLVMHGPAGHVIQVPHEEARVSAESRGYSVDRKPLVEESGCNNAFTVPSCDNCATMKAEFDAAWQKLTARALALEEENASLLASHAAMKVQYDSLLNQLTAPSAAE